MYKCPKCGSSEIMTVDSTVDSSLSASGDLECLQSNLRFEPDSRVDCGVCGHHGPAKSFEAPDPPSERERFGLPPQEWDEFLNRLGFDEGEVR